MYSAADITGAVVLSWTGQNQIGHFTEGAINDEKSNRGGASVIPRAVAYFTSLASQTGTNLGGLDATTTDKVNGALVFYIASEYLSESKELGRWTPCEGVDEDLPHYFRLQACRLLTGAVPAMSALALFCEPGLEDLPTDFFTSSSYDGCGDEINI